MYCTLPRRFSFINLFDKYHPLYVTIDGLIVVIITGRYQGCYETTPQLLILFLSSSVSSSYRKTISVAHNISFTIPRCGAIRRSHHIYGYTATTLFIRCSRPSITSYFTNILTKSIQIPALD